MTNEKTVLDPLDKLPWLPLDYSQHVIYGGMLGFVLLPFMSPLTACCVVAFVAWAKKMYDYFYEHETAQVCMDKTLVTFAIPALIVLWKMAGWL